MLKNYIKIAMRNFMRHKLYSFINVFGLAAGLAFIILIYLFIRHEFSYDRFHENAANIYRLNERELRKAGGQEEKDLLGYYKATGDVFKSAYLPLPLGPALKEAFPEVQQYCRRDYSDLVFMQDNKVFKEKVMLTDAGFFQVFSFPVLDGDPETVLNEKNKIVLTPEIARKYFGRTNPIGKSLTVVFGNEEKLFTVSGIAAAPPSNSSLQFSAVMPIENKTNYDQNMERWGSFNTTLFLELADGTSPAAFESKLKDFSRDRFQGTVDWITSRTGLTAADDPFSITLTPLTGIHLDASVDWPDTGNTRNILILSGIALLILVIACLNYIALALTSASGRVQEVGVRKVLGSSRTQVARQFWAEAQFLVLVSILIGILLTRLFLPVFNGFVKRELVLNLLQQPGILIALAVIALLTGLVAGGYPAAVFSRSKPVTALKGHSTWRLRPNFMRGTVLTQFTLSGFLIISSLIMYRQMQFINQQDLGYNKEQVLVLETNTGWTDEGERLKDQLRNELAANNEVLSVSGTTSSFNRGWDINGYETPDGENKMTFVYRIDYDYLKTLGIELADGRNFSPDNPSDITEGILVNEALVKDMNLESPIGAKVPWRKDHNQTIIGVMKDYYFMSLDSKMMPVVLHINPEEGKIVHILVKLAPGQLPEGMQAVEKAWKKVAPEKPFEYTFLDEDVAGQYESYTRWMNIVGISTIFAIFIACLGLFGLAGIMAVNKTKEIGIRKVLGATVANVVGLLSKEFVLIVSIAMVIATPAAWYAMDKWLGNFANHIDLGGWGFARIALTAVAAAALIAGLTVGAQSVKAALGNPVDSLRDE